MSLLIYKTNCICNKS